MAQAPLPLACFDASCSESVLKLSDPFGCMYSLRMHEVYLDACLVLVHLELGQGVRSPSFEEKDDSKPSSRIKIIVSLSQS
jgi:hypothetical protein